MEDMDIVRATRQMLRPLTASVCVAFAYRLWRRSFVLRLNEPRGPGLTLRAFAWRNRRESVWANAPESINIKIAVTINKRMVGYSCLLGHP
jgi:hypothetical protein